MPAPFASTSFFEWLLFLSADFFDDLQLVSAHLAVPFPSTNWLSSAFLEFLDERTRYVPAQLSLLLHFKLFRYLTPHVWLTFRRLQEVSARSAVPFACTWIFENWLLSFWQAVSARSAVPFFCTWLFELTPFPFGWFFRRFTGSECPLWPVPTRVHFDSLIFHFSFHPLYGLFLGSLWAILPDAV